MEQGLGGRKVAVLAADGVTRAELTRIREALERSGASLTLLSAASGQVRADAAGDAIRVDRTIRGATAAEFDALVVPGGDAHAQALSADAEALRLLREFMEADKPVAVLGHATGLLAAADVVRGRTVAGHRTAQDAVRGAGGDWVDKTVHADQKLITGRGGADLDAFVSKVGSAFASVLREEKLDELVQQSFPASDPPPGPASIGSATAGDDARA